MRSLDITDQAAVELNELQKQYPKITTKFMQLMLEVVEYGYDLPQTGKPEPLKGKNSNGRWSKRLTSSDRIIYKIENDNEFEVVRVFSCKYHYPKKH